MDRLDINFSRKKWKQIYHEIDRNYDDQVSFDEFILFLFPHNDVSTVRSSATSLVSCFPIMVYHGFVVIIN